MMGFRRSVKRLRMPYILTIGILTCFLYFYGLHFKQNKQIGTRFNLKTMPEKLNAKIHLKPNITKDILSNLKSIVLDNLNANHKLELISYRKLDKRDKYMKTINNEADNKNENNKNPLPVYVVEEHHEVIPYWFTAANKGIILKKGNTLIHIDGHSDMAPVEMFPGYPFFRWPSTKQLKYLMQSNDGFIQASVMTGLITRVIWIWPDWDKDGHDTDYSMSTLSLGWAVDVNHTKKAFCTCEKMDQGVVCLSITDMGYPDPNETDEPGYIVPIDKCRIEKIVTMEEVREATALSYLKKQNWLGQDESIILDIDEDYYGVTYAVEPLLKRNMVLKSIHDFDSLIQSLICPESFSDEHQSEILFLHIINKVILQKLCRKKEASTTNTCRSLTGHSKAGLIKNLLHDIEQANINKNIRLCPSRKDTLTDYVTDILYYLNKLNIKQLKAFRTVGFCLSTSFRTWQTKDMNRDERTFGVCSGINNPKDSSVNVHRTSSTEIKKRSIQMKLILKQLRTVRPKLMTLCRSVRDGYTPREHFEEIEQQVLSIVNQTFGGDTQIHYDESLLGGKQGWYHWHTKTKKVTITN